MSAQQKFNRVTVIQGVLTFVGAITVVEMIKEIPTHLKQYSENVFLIKFLVTLIVILAIVVIILFLEDDTISHVNQDVIHVP